MKKIMAVLMALALLIAACGSSDDDDEVTGDLDDTIEPEPDTEPEPEPELEPDTEPDLEPDPEPADECPTIDNPEADGVEQVDTGSNGSADADPELVQLATYETGTLKDGEGDPIVENAKVNACGKMEPLPTLECSSQGTDPEAYISLVSYVEWDPARDADEAFRQVNLEDRTEPSFEKLLDAIEAAETERAAEVIVGFDYILFPAMGYGIHPGDNPTRVNAAGYASQRADFGGEAPIVVLDTGYPASAPGLGFLNNVTPGSNDEEAIPPMTSDPGTAHGLMVAGVAGQASPGSPVEVYNAEDQGFGKALITLQSIKDALGRRLSDDPAIINMSFGTFACDEEELENRFGGGFRDLIDPDGLNDGGFDGLEPLRQFMAGLATQHILVASAGNNDTNLPMYPAALDDVIAVGAIDDTVPNTSSDGQTFDCGPVWSLATSQGGACGQPDPLPKAWYSNFGGWVDVCLPGTDLVTAYPENLTFAYLAYDHTTMKSTPVLVDTPGPLVRVSGTSMAAPMAAAQVAAMQDPFASWQGKASIADFVAAAGMAACP